MHHHVVGLCLGRLRAMNNTHTDTHAGTVARLLRENTGTTRPPLKPSPRPFRRRPSPQRKRGPHAPTVRHFAGDRQLVKFSLKIYRNQQRFGISLQRTGIDAGRNTYNTHGRTCWMVHRIPRPLLAGEASGPAFWRSYCAQLSGSARMQAGNCIANQRIQSVVS
jgi:hypothetical protein